MLGGTINNFRVVSKLIIRLILARKLIDKSIHACAYYYNYKSTIEYRVQDMEI